MKQFLLSLLFVGCLHVLATSQELYSSTIPTTRVNPGLGASGTPVVAFDDVNIPSAMVAGSDSVNITKLVVSVRRGSNAPATKLTLYYTPYDVTSTGPNFFIKIPPVLLETISLPPHTGSPINTEVSLGDSIATLFKIKTDTGKVFKGYQTFFVGASFDNANNDNGIRLAAGPGYNRDSIWIYDVNNTPVRYVRNFTSPVATFYMKVFGNAPTVLPVTLSAFSGIKKEKTNLLTWTTATEQDNKGFELQRSADGESFTTLAYIPSKAAGGHSSSAITYTFSDNGTFADAYYKLKEVHKDGKSTLSKVVFIKGLMSGSVRLTNVYPNPSRSILNVALAAPAADKVSIIISDLSGRIMMKQTANLIKGDNNLSINVSGLSAGNYFVKAIYNSGETIPVKFIKR